MSREVAVLNDDQARECLGRVSIWLHAMRECGQVLKLAMRARDDYSERWPPSPPLKADGTRDSIPSVDPAGKRFPTWEESLQIAGSLPLYAAVLFCQFDGSGKAEPGVVAANGAPMNAIRARVIEGAFRTPSELRRYERLAALIIDARNQKIAHAQGAAFKVKHGPGMVSWEPAPTLPDMREWLDCVGALELEMYSVQAELAGMLSRQ